MAKSKEQKREEARQRALRNVRTRISDLIRWVACHHMDLMNSEDGNNRWSDWTVKRLRSEVASFHAYLRDCGLPSGDGSFFILHKNPNIVLGDDALPYRQHKRKCLYCLQPRGQYHKAPCAHSQSGRVADHEALFIDERK